LWYAKPDDHSLTANLCFMSNDGVDMFLKHDSSTTLVGYK
jgi:hypothetical protein